MKPQQYKRNSHKREAQEIIRESVTTDLETSARRSTFEDEATLDLTYPDVEFRSDSITCPACDTEQYVADAYLGTLGRLHHYRCRYCGFTFHSNLS